MKARKLSKSDGANVAEIMKFLRKIPMTKPEFEPRNIEMKVGRSMTYTIRTPIRVTSSWSLHISNLNFFFDTGVNFRIISRSRC